MEIEKFIFVLMILVGVVALVLSVSLIVKENHKDNLVFNSDSKSLSSEYIGTYYPGSSSKGVLLSSDVNARNYCGG